MTITKAIITVLLTFTALYVALAVFFALSVFWTSLTTKMPKGLSSWNPYINEIKRNLRRKK